MNQHNNAEKSIDIRDGFHLLAYTQSFLKCLGLSRKMPTDYAASYQLYLAPTPRAGTTNFPTRLQYNPEPPSVYLVLA